MGPPHHPFRNAWPFKEGLHLNSLDIWLLSGNIHYTIKHFHVYDCLPATPPRQHLHVNVFPLFFMDPAHSTSSHSLHLLHHPPIVNIPLQIRVADHNNNLIYMSSHRHIPPPHRVLRPTHTISMAAAHVLLLDSACLTVFLRLQGAYLWRVSVQVCFLKNLMMFTHQEYYIFSSNYHN